MGTFNLDWSIGVRCPRIIVLLHPQLSAPTAATSCTYIFLTRTQHDHISYFLQAPVGIPGFPTPHQNGSYTAYGHVGDTYGYQSQTTYFPNHDFVVTVATNVETDTQAQPAEATCLAYHELVSMFEGQPPNVCNFTVPHHFIGVCSCERP